MNEEDLELLEDFITESLEHFEHIEEAMELFLGDYSSMSAIDRIFRGVHTIKGSAGFLNLTNIQELSHLIESVFDKIRSSELVVSLDIFHLLNDALDLLNLLLIKLSNNLENLSSSNEVFKFSKVTQTVQDHLNYLKDLLSNKKSNDEEVIQIDMTQLLKDNEIELIRDFSKEVKDNLSLFVEEVSNIDLTKQCDESFNAIIKTLNTIRGLSCFLNLINLGKLSSLILDIFSACRNGDLKLTNDILLESINTSDILIAIVTELDKKKNTLKCVGDIYKFSKITKTEATQITILEEILGDKSNFDSAKDKVDYKKYYTLFKDAEICLLKDFNADTFKDEEKGIKILESEQIIEDIISAWNLIDLTDDLDILKDVVKSMKDNSIPDMGKNAMIDMAKDCLVSIGKVVEVYYDNYLRETVSDEIETADKVEVLENDKAEVIETDNSKNTTTSKSMRVDQRLMDEYIEFVGELLIAHSSFVNAEKGFGEKNFNKYDVLEMMKNHSKTIATISENLQKNVIQMRRVKAKSVFNKFQKVVRDITRKNGKKVELNIEGLEVDIDKNIAEQIGDPLIHIIRNSLDHGVETPEVRKEFGKDEVGHVTLSAEVDDNDIIIKVVDDGAGIDPEKIGSIAVKKGVVSQEELDDLDEQGILNLIFKPGFSTAEKITDISGRGVGMDVVLTNITAIDGVINVSSVIGEGSVIEMKIPVISAITLSDSIIVEDKNETYALPLKEIKETIKLSGSKFKKMFQKDGFVLRNEYISISGLGELFGKPKRAIDNDKEFYLLILSTDNGKMGLIIDKIIKKDKIVVKDLDECFEGLPGLAGAAILGDDQPVLVLDPSELISLAKAI